MATQLYDFGMIGLGVMGSNFLLNMADHGFKVIGFDKDLAKGQAFEKAATAGTTVKSVTALEDMVQQLSSPRRIMMLVPAGKPVDDVIESLIPILNEGDIIIDGGNSHFTDTLRRVNYLQTKGLRFVGMGVSGGEEGARKGPSIMPGGDKTAYPHIQPMLESVAAKVNGEPCVAHLGNAGAGHYVKMVHNGIEYAIMEQISEIYELLKWGGNLTNEEMYEVFKKWNEGDLHSFLVEITRDIFLQKDEDGTFLLDKILDKAGAKGTGKWTSQDALDLGIPIPSIDQAVTMRNISSNKNFRVNAAALYGTHRKLLTINKEDLIQQAHDALLFGVIIAYTQGLSMIAKASEDLQMEIPMDKVVSVWRGGCIIRSSLLTVFSKVYSAQPDTENILSTQEIAELIKPILLTTRTILATAIANGYASGSLFASLSYFDAFTCAEMPTNMVQAQRDYFGAHTYQRKDKEGTFHTHWNA
ncbi:NADP-dependent phosphogluconate dehydrogenase [Gynurincola endophyticus]|uniref:NADP-dependent phosphogluconate dehydrogenase n=1 Tax=Gynurincola endophyticus TaxID=2479004 RepID=UPI000F8D724F|nr:NADP-dependent phosphogluconate dehydrogenase [Gynurincola endophyticus]